MFLSTPPSRVATCEKYASWKEFMFLSTPPSRVATILTFNSTLVGQVSIHATLAGGDFSQKPCFANLIMFLSTPPSRVATRCNSCLSQW